ncbi:MAG: hypothetical protein AAGA90_24150 [Actinomycetota bacterium]
MTATLDRVLDIIDTGLQNTAPASVPPHIRELTEDDRWVFVEPPEQT